MPVAVHNAVNCSWGGEGDTFLSSLMIYKYMYELNTSITDQQH